MSDVDDVRAADSWMPVLFDECDAEDSVAVPVAVGVVVHVLCAGTARTSEQSGTVLWPAAAALSSHVAAADILPRIFERCIARAVGVLELGAGTGLVGIAVAAVAAARGVPVRVLLTDHRCVRHIFTSLWCQRAWPAQCRCAWCGVQQRGRERRRSVCSYRVSVLGRTGARWGLGSGRGCGRYVLHVCRALIVANCQQRNYAVPWMRFSAGIELPECRARRGD